MQELAKMAGSMDSHGNVKLLASERQNYSNIDTSPVKRNPRKASMGVGHIAAGLIFKRVEPKVNLGLLFFAVLFSDFLLGVFYWSGLEQAYVPADYFRLHYLRFSFPYSHGLVASFFWSASAFLLAKCFCRNRNKDATKIGAIIGLAVFSHFILDFIVHERELPTLGSESVKLGLGLWNNMAMAAVLEMMLVVVGLVLYLPVTKNKRDLKGSIGVLTLMVVFSTLTLAAMLTSKPPDLTAAAVSWIVAPLVLSGLGFWLDRPAQPKKHYQ